jgi:hypothetical protein
MSCFVDIGCFLLQRSEVADCVVSMARVSHLATRHLLHCRFCDHHGTDERCRRFERTHLVDDSLGRVSRTKAKRPTRQDSNHQKIIKIMDIKIKTMTPQTGLIGS